MTDAAVTVVRCGRCGRTGELAWLDGRFWCAWCQDWAAVLVEAVPNAVIEREDGLPKLIGRPPDRYRLQPLRVPGGWTVAYNNGLYEVDPSDVSVPEGERWLLFKEDMLQMRHERTNRLLDLGWHPEGDMEAGEYGLVVYEGDCRGRILHESGGRDRAALVAEIERLCVAIAEGQR